MNLWIAVLDQAVRDLRSQDFYDRRAAKDFFFSPGCQKDRNFVCASAGMAADRIAQKLWEELVA